MSDITNQITISRDDAGCYVIDDYCGRIMFEQFQNAIEHITSRLQQQDRRIAEFRAHPEEFVVKGISQLVC